MNSETLNSVYTISVDWEGQVGICTSYDLAYQLLADYVRSDDLPTLLAQELAIIKKVQLNQISY